MTDHATSNRSTRSLLQKVRDVALTIMAILVSAISAFAIYVIITAGSALYRVDDKIDNPVPAITDKPSPTLSPTE
jgi:hypothetical protein